jgi:DNA gyrase/topoisomerase IV subunit B
MYIGSTGARGLEQMLREVLSNSMDLALTGAVTEIGVRLERDGGFVVTDNGPGIEVAPCDDGVPFLTHVVTTYRDTPTADGHEPHVHLAVGIGLHTVCVLTDRLEITTTRGGRTWRQRFAVGRATSPLEQVPDAAVGTTVSFRPDPAIFDTGERLDLSAIDGLLADLSALVPGLTTRLEVEDSERPPHDISALLPARPGQSWQLRAEDEQAGLVIAFTTTYGRQSADGRWLLNLRELVGTEPLARSLDKAVDAVAGPERKGLKIVASAMMLSPQFSGPTRATCDDPRLKQLIRQAVKESLPALLESDPSLRTALSID